MRKLTTLNKATRKEAYEFAQVIHDGQPLTDTQRDLLLNYFAPALPKIAKDAFSWVARACGDKKKELRQFLHVVHVKGGVMVACCGHRVHWAMTDLPDGQYDPATGALLDPPIPNVPDFERVKGTPGEGVAVFLQDLEIAAREHFSPLVKVSDRAGFDVRYMLAALNEKHIQGTAHLEGMLLTGQSPFGTYSIMAVGLPGRVA